MRQRKIKHHAQKLKMSPFTYKKTAKPKQPKSQKKSPAKVQLFSKLNLVSGSIKTKFIIAFVSFALVPLLILCLVYTIVSRNALSKTSDTLNLEIVRQATSNLDTQVATIEEDLVDLGANTILRSGLLRQIKSTNRSESTSALLGLNNILSNFKVSQTAVVDICILLEPDFRPLGSITSLSVEELAEYVTQLPSTDFIWDRPEDLTPNNVLITKKYNDMTSRTNYFTISRFNTSGFSNYLGGLSLLDDSSVYLVTSNGTIIYATDSKSTALPSHISENMDPKIPTTSFSAGKDLITYGTLSNGWKLIVQTPYSSLTRSLDTAFAVVILLLVITIILAVVLGYFYANNFSKPIIGLMNLMGKAENGDLTVEATVQGKDEIANLCASFNHMIDNIRKLINQTQEVIIHTLDDSETLSHSADHSVSTIQELATAVSEIAQGTTTQALDAQKSTQDMQGLARQMDMVSTKTSTLLTNTEGAKSMIENATNIVQSLTTTMNSSLNMTNDICSSINELNTLNRNVEGILKLIEGISEQTNLLALNASIEAARVGEAGKGFAVVANEVRNLADQSKTSTVNIRTTLNTISKKMNETVSLAQNSRQIIGDQEKVVNETHALFNQIIQILSKMLSELADIDVSVGDMRRLKEVMINQIDSIASVTEESAASTEEVSSLATEQQNVMSQLSNLSNQLTHNMEMLNQTITAFKVSHE